jgi:hypothetical protein
MLVQNHQEFIPRAITIEETSLKALRGRNLPQSVLWVYLCLQFHLEEPEGSIRIREFCREWRFCRKTLIKSLEILEKDGFIWFSRRNCKTIDFSSDTPVA